MADGDNAQTTLSKTADLKRQTSGLAIASAVMGLMSILGFAAAICLQQSGFGLIGIVGGPFVGLPLGIGALVAIKGQSGRLGGKGWAILGICLSSPFLVALCLVCVLLLLERGMPEPYVAQLKALLSGRHPNLGFKEWDDIENALTLVVLGAAVFLYAVGWRKPQRSENWKGLLTNRRPWIALGLIAMIAGGLAVAHIVLSSVAIR